MCRLQFISSVKNFVFFEAFSVVLKTYNVNTEDIHRDDSESSDVSGMDVDSEEADLIVVSGLM